MSSLLILLFELMGTVAFAWSGAMIAIQKKMDLLGVILLGLTTATGGGVIRDLLLGNTPPMMFRNPMYALLAIATSVVVFLPVVRRFFHRRQHLHELILLVMDSFGLGIFTAAGIRTAMESTESFNVFLFLFVGVLTGVGGGVLRDVMAGDMPYIFVKHFYASASILGGAACIALWPLLGETPSMFLSAALTILLRLLAARYHWNLPKSDE
ncbi:MAG: trimeric intracellular cation channel family protein [Ruminococcaceae bacterium]|nr:trimeric intracellular cation channel family protein [Oscillospiraceae bacterium]